jgi:hypothetical protein
MGLPSSYKDLYCSSADDEMDIISGINVNSTYDHRSVKTRHPVRNHRLSFRCCLLSEDPGEKKVL